MTDSGHSVGQRRRPHVVADVERLAGPQWHGEPAGRLELAHTTAAAVVRAGRDGAGAGAGAPDLLTLADEVGLDTLAELWRLAADDSLPGVLWVLYLLRSWCQSQDAALARWYEAGRNLAPVAEVVAGVRDVGDPEAVRRLADDVLTGAYGGDFAVALDRAASFFRIVAIGRVELANDAERAVERERAERNVRTAEALERAAGAWREGVLR